MNTWSPDGGFVLESKGTIKEGKTRWRKWITGGGPWDFTVQSYFLSILCLFTAISPTVKILPFTPFLLLLFIYCVCVNTCYSRHVPVMWRTEVTVRCPPQYLFILFLETVSHCSSLIWLDWLAHEPRSSSCLCLPCSGMCRHASLSHAC